MPATVRLDLERELNPEQLAAVTHGEGPQLVLAGAGSGKTRVITYRIAWLVHERGIDPASIVAVTFTNKAAGEMQERVEKLVQLYPLTTFVGTFHRFALRLLRRHGALVGLKPDFAIFDSNDQISLVKKALAAENLSETAFAPRVLLGTISSAKNRLLDPQSYTAAADNFFERQVAKVYGRYQSMLRDSSGVDFDDMLLLAVRLIASEPELRQRLRQRIDYLLVDEFQDTNHAQMRLVQELVGDAGNLTAVGDEDQGIYRWRGADLDNVLNFEAGFPGATVRALERAQIAFLVIDASEGFRAQDATIASLAQERGCATAIAASSESEAAPTSARSSRMAHQSAGLGSASIAKVSGIQSAEGRRMAA